MKHAMGKIFTIDVHVAARLQLVMILRSIVIRASELQCRAGHTASRHSTCAFLHKSPALPRPAPLPGLHPRLTFEAFKSKHRAMACLEGCGKADEGVRRSAGSNDKLPSQRLHAQVKLARLAVVFNAYERRKRADDHREWMSKLPLQLCRAVTHEVHSHAGKSDTSCEAKTSLSISVTHTERLTPEPARRERDAPVRLQVADASTFNSITTM